MSSFTHDNSHPGSCYLTSLLVQNCFHLLWQIPPVAYPFRMLLQSAVLRVINFEHITLVLEAFHCLFSFIIYRPLVISSKYLHIFAFPFHLCSLSKNFLKIFQPVASLVFSWYSLVPPSLFSMKTIEPLTMSSLLMHQSQHILCLLSADIYLIR